MKIMVEIDLEDPAAMQELVNWIKTQLPGYLTPPAPIAPQAMFQVPQAVSLPNVTNEGTAIIDGMRIVHIHSTVQKIKFIKAVRTLTGTGLVVAKVVFDRGSTPQFYELNRLGKKWNGIKGQFSVDPSPYLKEFRLPFIFEGKHCYSRDELSQAVFNYCGVNLAFRLGI